MMLLTLAAAYTRDDDVDKRLIKRARQSASDRRRVPQCRFRSIPGVSRDVETRFTNTGIKFILRVILRPS